MPPKENVRETPGFPKPCCQVGDFRVPREICEGFCLGSVAPAPTVEELSRCKVATENLPEKLPKSRQTDLATPHVFPVF